MPALSSDARFLGLDLHDLARQFRESWEGASTWSVFSWLNPVMPVCLLQADGRDVIWTDGKRAQATLVASVSAAFTAIEIPEDLLLRRSVRLPAMGAADRLGALALDARSASPFAPEDLVWGAGRPDNSSPFSLVLASRKQLMAYQSSLGDRVPASSVPEFWVLDDRERPLVLAGFGESHRLGFVARRRRTGVTLLASAAAIAILILLTPSLQLQMRFNAASEAYAEIAASAAPAIARREALVRAADRTTALRELLAERIEPLRLLEVLTRILPDDTALQTLQLAGTKVAISGLTPNASSLMQLLGNEPGFRDVRAPVAATRVPGIEKEAFAIEFNADPERLGVWVAAAVSSPSAVQGDALEVTSVPVPAQIVVTRLESGGAAFGGSATSRGANTKPTQAAPQEGGKP